MDIEAVPVIEKHPRLLIPVMISILAFIGWLIFLLWYTLFWSADFTLFQNIVITVISLLVVAGFIALMWVIWGFRAGRQWTRPPSFPAATRTALTEDTRRIYSPRSTKANRIPTTSQQE